MKVFFGFALVTILLLPFVAEAQFGPIIPEACRACPCGFGGVLAIIQNVVNFIIGLSIIFATIIIVWAGGLYILSATNPESRSTANKMLINAAIGLVIVLSAWLIVDFVMKALYNNESEFGPWNSILAGDGEEGSCIVASTTTPPSLFDGNLFTVPGGGTPGTGGGSCTPIPDSELVAFDSSATAGGTERALASTVEKFMAMRAAALRDGIDLKVSSGYRSPEEQLAAWNANGCQLVNDRAVCRTRTAAVPCSLGGGGSNHTSGTAVDIRLGTGAYDWLKRNGGQYGFYNNLPNDLPHWSPTGR